MTDQARKSADSERTASPSVAPLLRDTKAFWHHYEKYHRSVIAAGLVTGLAAATELAMLAILATITVNVGGKGVPTPQFFGGTADLSVGLLLVLAFVLVLVRFGCNVYGTYLAARLGARYELEKRAEFVDAYLNASWPAQAAQRGHEAQDVVTNAMMYGRTGLKSVASVIGSAFSMAVMLAGALAMSWMATLVAIVLSAALAMSLQPLVRRSKALSSGVRDSSLAYVTAFGETITMSREIRLTGVAGAFKQRLADVSTRLRRQRTHEQVILNTTPLIFETGAFLIVLLGLAALHFGNFASSAQFVAMLLLLLRASQYGRSLQSTYHTAKSSMPYLDMIDEREQQLRGHHVGGGERQISDFQALDLKSLGYSYDSHSDAIRDITMHIDRGDVIGIIGPSGSGKTTLVEILLGLRSPTKGAYLVDGHPQTELELGAWHRMTGLVTQEPQLIEGSVRENIRFLRDDITDDDVDRAVLLSGLSRDLTSLEDGLDTLIGPRSSGLSGGQKQRLSIARVLVSQPTFLVLDEPTSALDVHAEAVITNTLDSLKGTTTIVVVAHRLSTLRACDKVAVIRNGNLEAFSDRSALEENSAYYKSAIDLAQITR